MESLFLKDEGENGVLCAGRLDDVVPLENAAIANRTVIEWDRTDCEDMGIVKVGLLGLGMMKAVEETLQLCQDRGVPIDLAHMPEDDTATYDMLCKADTIGLFQVEFRAQMASLPRFKPRTFYLNNGYFVQGTVYNVGLRIKL